MDLMRLKRDVVRSTNYPASARTVANSNFRRILPIPQSEADANPTIRPQQNPGY
jgi:starch-binding outer membrane protein, SusD/RagB family